MLMVLAKKSSGIGASRPSTRAAPSPGDRFNDGLFRGDIGAQVTGIQFCLRGSACIVVHVKHDGLAAVGQDVPGYCQAEAGNTARHQRFHLVQLHWDYSFR
jgi:hypothetical protein